MARAWSRLTGPLLLIAGCLAATALLTTQILDRTGPSALLRKQPFGLAIVDAALALALIGVAGGYWQHRGNAKRKRTEEELQLFRSLIDRSNEGIEVVDVQTGRILDINARLCENLGYTREEMLGMSLWDFNPSLTSATWPQMAERLRRERRLVIEFSHRRKDGRLIPVEVNVAWVTLDRDYLIATIRDLSELKRSEEARRHSEDRLRELAATIDEVFWVMDPNFDVLYISPAYEKIWGRTCASLHAAPFSWLESIHPEDRDRVEQAWREQQETGRYDEEYRIFLPDGQIRWIHDRGYLVRDERGRIVRIVGVAKDFTERHNLETQLRHAQKMEAIGQLAGGIAHDFNNVLSVITVHSDLMLAAMEPGDPDAESITDIQEAAQRAAALTRQLLVFSRQQVVEPQLLDLNAAVRDAGKMLRRLIGEDIQLTTSLAAELARVRMDPGHLGQVVMNLAVNARDAMPRGGQLTIETSEVELDEAYAAQNPDARSGRNLLLAITDTGCGMTPEVRSRIFDPFFTTKGIGRGTGLGLAVVHGIVKQSGGHLGVYSEPGVGTTFKIYLPVADGRANSTPSADSSQPANGVERILLVEDEDTVRKLTTVALERLGYSVLAAANGEQALALTQSCGRSIDLLVTDVVMPGINGRELADRLRPAFPELKVLFRSGYTDDAVVRHGILHAEVAFMQKPFTVKALATKVRAVLDESTSAESSRSFSVKG